MDALVAVVWLVFNTSAPWAHAQAAIEAGTQEVPARLLLEQARRESTWRAPGQLVVSRMEGGRRVTGVIKSFAGTAGPYFCGALQLKRNNPADCQAINADLAASYAGARDHILLWKGYCERMGRTASGWRVCALSGYAGGVKGTRINGKARKYALGILRRAGLLPARGRRQVDFL